MPLTVYRPSWSFAWAWAKHPHPSELRRSTRISYETLPAMEFPVGSGRTRPKGFRLFINIPWVGITVGKNAEEMGHDFLMSGVELSYGRNKGWSERRENFYRHTIRRFCTLKPHPLGMTTIAYVESNDARTQQGSAKHNHKD